MLALSVAAVTTFFAGNLHRLPAPTPIDGVTPAARLALFFMMMAASWIGMQLTAIFLDIKLDRSEGNPFALSDEVRLALGIAAAQGIVVAVYALLVRRGDRQHDAQRPPRVSNLMAAVLGVCAMILVWPLVSAVGILGGWLRHDADPLAHEALRHFTQPDDPRWQAAMGVLVVIVGPMLEEVSYRGLLQRAVRQTGVRPWPAILFTSLLFAMMHWTNSDPQAVAAILVFSLALGWAYEKTGRLLAPIVMHVVFNLSNLMLAMWLVA